MCYSAESSLRTTAMSLLSIVYLLSSNIPHFQWIGMTLVGWCSMQFAEFLLWLTEPQKQCTLWNTAITMTLIPIVLIMQPLGVLWGSLYVFPWNKSSDLRKNFLLVYTLIVVLSVFIFNFINPEKICTTVTKEGHLLWATTKEPENNYRILKYFIWGILVILPFFIFWNKSIVLPIALNIFPFVGFWLGLRTDSRGSIWCNYTSYSSVVGAGALFLQQTGLYNFI